MGLGKMVIRVWKFVGRENFVGEVSARFGYLRWMERISSTEVWGLRLWDEMVMARWMGKRGRGKEITLVTGEDELDHSSH